MRIDFDWDPVKAASNAAKHGVAFKEAMTVFRDPLTRSIPDTDHPAGEERWVTLGATATGNLLVVVHALADSDAERISVRIISARGPTRTKPANIARSRCREGRIRFLQSRTGTVPSPRRAADAAGAS
ncbi:MAG: BrnT family toxin [Methylobacteriaceae bacterium]|nr:BrnT family toxin [Methylobacteriaceae bacterium]